MGLVDTRRSGRAIALAVLIVAVGALRGAPASAASAGGISLAPAHFDPSDPATRSYFKPVVARGSSFHGQVLVSNSAQTPVELIVSPVDGLTAVTSGAVYANRQDPIVKAGTWTHLAVSHLSLGPRSSTKVDFVVSVPADAAPGDHLAGIAFEDSQPRTSGGGFGVTEVIRSVIGVEIQVPGPAVFRIHVDRVMAQLQPGIGTASLLVSLGDDGLLVGKPTLAISLAGPHGYHRQVSRHLDTLLPGDTIPFPFPWPDDLRPGQYRATVVATGGAALVTAEFDFHLGTELPATLTPPHRSHHSRGTVVALLCVAALGVLIGLGLGRRRRPRPDDEARGGIDPSPKPDRVPVGVGR